MLRSRRLHAGHRLDSKRVSSRLVPGQRLPPVFDDVPTLSTLYQPMTCARLRYTHLTELCSAFSLTLTTTTFDRSSLRWFEASACTATPKGPPSSFVQHCFGFLTRHAFVAHSRPHNRQTVVLFGLVICPSHLTGLRTRWSVTLRATLAISMSWFTRSKNFSRSMSTTHLRLLRIWDCLLYCIMCTFP